MEICERAKDCVVLEEWDEEESGSGGHDNRVHLMGLHGAAILPMLHLVSECLHLKGRTGDRWCVHHAWWIQALELTIPWTHSVGHRESPSSAGPAGHCL